MVIYLDAHAELDEDEVEVERGPVNTKQDRVELQTPVA